MRKLLVIEMVLKGLRLNVITQGMRLEREGNRFKDLCLALTNFRRLVRRENIRINSETHDEWSSRKTERVGYPGSFKKKVF